MKATPQQKAENLINFFTDAKRPVCPFKLKQGTIVLNVDTAIEVSSNILRVAKPGTQAFVAAYFNLWDIKQYIKNERNSPDNGQ